MILAFAIAAFVVPQDLIVGGVTRIGILLNRFLQTDVAVIVLVLNILALLLDLQAGVTMVLIETGCAGQRQEGVLCVIPPRKLFAAKEMIHSIDPEAFITVTQIKEVRGQGVTLARKTVPLKLEKE